MFHRDNQDLCHQMKRSKQKNGQSPRLGPSPRLRSNSISSPHSTYSGGTPDIGPMPMQLEPTQMTIGTGIMNNSDINVANIGGGAATGTGTGTGTGAGQHHATTFRTLSSSFQMTEGFRVDGTTRLPTGLGILLSPDGNLVTGKIAPTANTQQQFQQQQPQSQQPQSQQPQHHFPHVQQQQQQQSMFVQHNVQTGLIDNITTQEQHRLMEQDIMDRERQASSLAAAGMVAEQVSHTGHNNDQHNAQMLNINIDVANEYDMALGEYGHPLSPNAMEEMELDFSRMFDPSYEIQSMETEGSGWPTLNNNNNNNINNNTYYSNGGGGVNQAANP